MKTKNLLLTTLVVAITAATVLFLKQGQNTSPVDSQVLFAGKNIDVAVLEKILIRSKDQETLLIKNNENRWEVQIKKDSLPANALMIYNLINEIKEKKIEFLVAEGAKKFSDYGLDIENKDRPGKIIVGYSSSEKKEFELVLGSERTGGENTKRGGVYARFDNSEKIYLLRENLNAETDSQNWVQRSVLNSLLPETIRSLETVNSVFDFKISRTEADKLFSWKGKEIAKSAADNAIGKFKNFKIKSYVANSSISVKTLKKSASIKIELFNQTEILLSFFDSKITFKNKEIEDKILKIQLKNPKESDLKFMGQYFEKYYLIERKLNFDQLFITETELKLKEE